ncbi:N-Dimethylarginine dimethylaminohydrolase [Micromonospora coxensis]|uniref:N-Dimethylarginine dimethylaminohydrolase n=2 Tax=Micromonospora coxensis TaxID=356852 RepID=A0A1C5H2S8_9ACTN|nr:N-Dimethylarginine dimethylaminohydrolase [Micromonospora coxensis]
MTTEESTRGRHYLMCPPDYFEVSYSINPWMDTDVAVNEQSAHEQWRGLVETIREVGGLVEQIPAVPQLPDMVFVANGGIVSGDFFLPAAMRHPERQGETPHLRAWFEEFGCKVLDPPAGVQEGAGDALAFGDVLVAGYGLRSERAAYDDIVARTGWRVLPVRLVDPRLYHVDIAFCPLDDRQALVAPDAFDREGRRALADLVPDPVLLTMEEALAFSANSIVVGHVVIMPACSARLEAELRRRGFEVVVRPVGEFLKAGGGVRCLTLTLDTVLPSGAGGHD